jgi:pentatricopeptide repeat protein
MMQFHLHTRPSRQHVLHYYNALLTSNVPPSAHTYKLLLDAWSVLDPVDLGEMEKVFGELCRNRDVEVQGTHWASLITAYGIHGDDLDKALSVFDGIERHPTTKRGRGEFSHDPVVWEAVLNVVGSKGSVGQLEEMRVRMEKSGAKGTAYVCNALISGYARGGEIEKAREVFESMGDSIGGEWIPFMTTTVCIVHTCD